jgi:transposase InsO family protein
MRQWPLEITREIRRLRTEYPNLGKEKLSPFLQAFCGEHALTCPKPKTIGRIIASAPDKMRTFPVKVRHNGQIVPRKRAVRVRKPKHFVATHAGHCGAFDTIERFIHGCRRYVLTFTDVYSRFSFAWATTSHASGAAKEFFTIVSTLFPYPLEHILTDNGSEFMKHFDQEVRALHKVHWHTYPKTPKMNAHCERFNRTIQEEFVDYHEPLLLNPYSFNKQLVPWLLWYNGERPHWSLKLKSPIQFLMEQNPKECNMWWPNTRT